MPVTAGANTVRAAAIVGGGMVAAIHRRAIRVAGGAVVGVLGSRPERSAQIAAGWGVAAFPDLDALLGGDVNVVHVCTPNSTHARYATAVLRSGRHLVCEKPVATSAAEAQSLPSLRLKPGSSRRCRSSTATTRSSASCARVGSSATVFDQENPETAWIGTPDGATVIARGAGQVSDDERPQSYLPGGHAQG